jgi:hypothetical protein
MQMLPLSVLLNGYYIIDFEFVAVYKKLYKESIRMLAIICGEKFFMEASPVTKFSGRLSFSIRPTLGYNWQHLIIDISPFVVSKILMVNSY